MGTIGVPELLIVGVLVSGVGAVVLVLFALGVFPRRGKK
jgi:hypothetical protein